MRVVAGCVVVVGLGVFVAVPEAWNNGPAGNTTTNIASECDEPRYATHDWIADRALDLLPDDEKDWLEDEEDLYLLGTEAPDNRNIPLACDGPHRGYDDRSRGHSITWNAGGTQMTNDRAAVRAQEEYSKAIIAFEQGEEGHAAFYLGAMAHYIGDVSQYGHSWPNEVHHGNYESWVASRTAAFSGGMFDSYIQLDSLVRRTPYTAARRVSVSTFRGNDRILRASEMDSLWSMKPQRWMDSTGDSLNLAVNELADVLHTFYLNVVMEEE